VAIYLKELSDELENLFLQSAVDNPTDKLPSFHFRNQEGLEGTEFGNVLEEFFKHFGITEDDDSQEPPFAHEFEEIMISLMVDLLGIVVEMGEAIMQSDYTRFQSLVKPVFDKHLNPDKLCRAMKLC
jgi:hypothetical protein